MNDSVIEHNTNGGWCWYQDDRVVVDRKTGAIVFCSVANFAGTDGERRDGDIDVTTFDPAGGSSNTVTLKKILTNGHGDDHNVAALWHRPDGRYVAMYTGHNYGGGSHGGEAAPTTFFRLSQPHDATRWGDEKRLVWPSNDPVGQGHNQVTYSNLLHLSDEGGAQGRLYNIARAAGQVWQIVTSDDWGESWEYRGFLTLPPAGGRAYSNGYMKFVGNGVDRIDFITTQAHPRDYNNGVYHGFIQNGQTHDSFGNVIDPQTFSTAAPQPEQFTPLFVPDEVAEGRQHHGWTVELIRDGAHTLRALFTTRVGTASAPNQITRPAPGDADHRLHLARFDGRQWHAQELAEMGGGLHDAEEDYTGLGAIDPIDGRTIYISTPIDPRDRRALSHHEIFRARRDGDDQPWSWTPMTEHSDVDNLRPRLARLGPDRAWLLWLRGSYPHQREYDQAVVGCAVD